MMLRIFMSLRGEIFSSARDATHFLYELARSAAPLRALLGFGAHPRPPPRPCPRRAARAHACVRVCVCACVRVCVRVRVVSKFMCSTVRGVRAR